MSSEISYAQHSGICPIVKFDTDWSEKICLDYKSDSSFYSFMNNEDAIKYVEKLMHLTGLPMNFIVSECSGIQNAFAYTYKGVQYIFYGKEFLESLNTNSNDIASVTVLAHEIGHHLSGHTSANSYVNKYCIKAPCNKLSQDCLDALEISRNRELQADRFAGFIMYKFGASLSETQNGFKILYNFIDKDDSCSTHPRLQSRLDAIQIGYDTAIEQELNPQLKPLQTEKEKLEYIKGGDIALNMPNTNVIERNKIINNLWKIVVRDVRADIKQNSDYELVDSAAKTNETTQNNLKNYLGDSYDLRTSNGSINNDEEFFLYNVASLKFENDSRINYGPALGYHSKNGIVKIVQFSDSESPKTVYSSIASKDKIDYTEVKKILTDVYEKGLQTEIDKVFKNKN